jgi:2-methylcitrate dehydratase PrpD
MTLSRRLAGALGRIGGDALPASVQEAARLHLLDAIGVGLAAGASEVGRPYARYAAFLPDGPASLLCGGSAGAADAAMVNGGLIHSLEYDDTHTGSIVHGSAVLASTALACAQASGASGPALLGAYTAGWEMLVRIGLAAPGQFQARGFQVTSVGGAMAAAAVASLLLRLDTEQMVNAIGIALSQGSGVFEFLTNGSTVKSLHPGWAAQAGITAARLAACGMTGPETAIEGRFGLFACFAGDPAGGARFEATLQDIGTRWHLLDAALKFSPCCHYLHPFIEAASELRRRGVRPEAIADVVCRAPAGTAGVICEPWPLKQTPPSPHAARWSLPVATAAAMIGGGVDLATFEQPISPEVLALAARMRWEALPDAAFPERFEAELIVRCADGTVERVRIDDAYGNASRPATADAVREKFRANARRAGAPAAAFEAAIDALAEDGLGPLSAALAAVQRKGASR